MTYWVERYGKLNYASGKKTKKEFDAEKAPEVQRCAEQGIASAQYDMGQRCKDGNGVYIDDREAVKWYRLAAEQNHSDALFQLGHMYEHGKGVKKDNEKAAEYYYRSANQGNATALEYCARGHARGNYRGGPFPKNPEEVIRFLNLLIKATKGRSRSMFKKILEEFKKTGDWRYPE